MGVACNRAALRLDPGSPTASFHELNRRSGGRWGLKNAVFAKDAELLELFGRFGTHQNAQVLQDLAYLKFFPPKAGGFFVEVGVGDGVHLSNTVLFEREWGWDGLLVEPNPAFHESIRTSRRAPLDARAASNAAHESVLFQSDGELSRLQAAEYRDQHHREGESIAVSTATLTQILEDCGAPAQIDFMSIDTEGSELDVLNGLDFGRYRVEFVTVEHNYVDAKRLRVREFLEGQGYRCVSNAASLWDDWFVRGQAG